MKGRWKWCVSCGVAVIVLVGVGDIVGVGIGELVAVGVGVELGSVVQFSRKLAT